MTDRQFAEDVVRRLQAAGFRGLWAGGCVRDELLGLAPADYDVATDARPDQVHGLFRRCHAFGASFGVVEVLGPRGPDGDWLKVQVATFRSDGAYTDGRRPDAVTFATPEEDARRRDFTVNGMFFDPVAGQVLDFVGGRADLEAGVLRAIGDPAERFAEDKLRILRAVRMAARFALAVDPATAAAARGMADRVTVVSPERIADEFRKLLAHPNRARGLTLLRDLGLVPPVFPELAARPDADWATVARAAGRLGPAATFPAAFAVLLGDLGPKAVEAVGRRLRLSNAEVDRTAWLAAHRAAVADAPALKPSRLYPLLAHPGAAELVAVTRAEAEAAGRDLAAVAFCERLMRDKSPAELSPPPLLTGDDLRALGYPPGPKFKAALEAVRTAQLDDGIDRPAAEALAKSRLG